MNTQKRVAYNPYVHGSMDAWREGTPKKRGYYTVMTQPQKALVCDRIHFCSNGSPSMYDAWKPEMTNG